jgi:hypothetical protein
LGPWISRSRPGVQVAVATGFATLGVLMTWVLRDGLEQGGNVRAGLLLGVLLVLIGVGGLLVSAPQTVSVDPRARAIEVIDGRLVGAKRTIIAFNEVARVSIGYLGKASNFVNTYYLVLHLADGREYPLFAPGRFYEGASDRRVVEGWRERLEGYLAHPERG